LIGDILFHSARNYKNIFSFQHLFADIYMSDRHVELPISPRYMGVRALVVV